VIHAVGCDYTLRFSGENDKGDGGKATAAALGAIAGGAAGFLTP
jgi:hypothetical protein